MNPSSTSTASPTIKPHPSPESRQTTKVIKTPANLHLPIIMTTGTITANRNIPPILIFNEEGTKLFSHVCTYVTIHDDQKKLEANGRGIYAIACSTSSHGGLMLNQRFSDISRRVYGDVHIIKVEDRRIFDEGCRRFVDVPEAFLRERVAEWILERWRCVRGMKLDELMQSRNGGDIEDRSVKAHLEAAMVVAADLEGTILREEFEVVL